MSALRLIDDYDVSGDRLTATLPPGPAGLRHGSLPNGMTYGSLGALHDELLRCEVHSLVTSCTLWPLKT
jgi:hypothetical protein